LQFCANHIADQVPDLKTVLVTGVFDPLPTVTEYPAGKPIDGKTVAPFMDFLRRHPAIGMCALMGVPNPECPDSEIVKLVVQKSEAYADKSDDEIKDELLAFAREKLSPYKVPKIIEFVHAIPLTSVGKVNKKSMR